MTVIILVFKQIRLPLRGRPILLITRMKTDRIHLLFSNNTNINVYILLDILVCSIAVYFYESCSILASLKGESAYK